MLAQLGQPEVNDCAKMSTMNQDGFFAFVLMPFDTSFDDVYKIGIKETADSLDILAERVDEQLYRESILERIYHQIEEAHIVIADMTGKNANVFYEVGYAHARGKLCILITADADDIPFDLKHRRHIVYGRSVDTLRARLREELEWAREEIRKARKSRIALRTQSFGGALRKNQYYAEGDVEFTIDLTNDAETNSPDIEALYFYSQRRWAVLQDGKRCGSTEADLKPHELRHFLTPPLRRLAPGAWCQLKFTATGRLGSTIKGEDLKGSYPITGRSTLRIVTLEGNFDHAIDVDVTIDDLPF